MEIEMLDTISDFHKRFGENGTPVDYVFCPAPLVLFGTGAKDVPVPETVLALSFGTGCAYRVRGDGRIVLASSETDTAPSINVCSIGSVCGKNGSDGIFSAMRALPCPLSGAELLICSDVSAPEFAPEKLCALLAEAKASGANLSAKTLLCAAHADARYIISLCGAKALRLNPATLDYAEIKCSMPGKKIVIAKISAGVKIKQPPHDFSQRERVRGEAAMAALAYADTAALGKLMLDSGSDRLATRRAGRTGELFKIAARLAPSTVLADFSGIASLVDDGGLDDFILVCGDSYEKKTGTRPAFYISD